MSSTIAFDIVARDRASDKFDKLGGSAEKSSGRLAKFAKAAALAGGAAALAAGKGLYEIGRTFDDVSDTIRVGTGATGKNLKALEESAKNVGTSIPAAFADVGPTIADINTRLGLTGKPLEKLSKQFLEAGRITGQALDINKFTAAFSAFDVQGAKTSKTMDMLYRVSQATGLGMNELADSVAKNAPNLKQFGFSIEDSAALIGTLDKAGLDSNKTLATLSRAMVTFAEEGKNPQKALLSTVEQIENFTKAGKNAKAVNLAADIFGTRGASQFVAAVKSGKVNLDALMQSTGATGDTILKAGRDTADFSEKWLTFKNKVMVAVEPIATRLFNSLGTGADKMAVFVDQMKAGEGTGGKVASVFKTIGTNLDTIAPTLGVITAGMLTYAAASKAVAVATAIQTAGTVGATGATWSLNAALRANPIGLVVTALTALGVGFVIAYKKSETFRTVVDGALTGVKKGFDALGKAGTWLWNNALQPAFKFIVNGIASILDLWSTMLAQLGKVPGFGWAKDAAEAMGAAADKARGLADGIKKIPNKTVTVTVAYKYTGRKGGAGSTRGDSGGQLDPSSYLGRGNMRATIQSATNDFFDALADGMKKGGKKLDKVLDASRTRLRDKLGGIRDEMKSMGESIASALNQVDFSGSLSEHLASLTGTNGALAGLTSVFESLKNSVSKGYLSSLMQSGNVGLATALANDPAAAAQASALYDSNAAMAQGLGDQTAQQVLGDKIEKALKEEIGKMLKELKDAPGKHARELRKEIKEIRLEVKGLSAGQRAYLRGGG